MSHADTAPHAGAGAARNDRDAIRRRPWFALVVAAAAVLVAPALSGVLPGNLVYVATSVVVAVASLLALGIVTGTAGMIALCQLTFAAVGAWVLEFLLLRTAIPDALGGAAFIVAMIVAGVVAAVFGVLVGLPALRLRGVNLAVVTLGVAAAADMTLQKIAFPDQWENAKVARPFDVTLGAAGDRAYFVFAVVVVVLIALGVHALQRSRWGATWRAVAFSERGTASAGASVRFAKLTAFGTSAFIGGIAGALMVGQISQVNYVTFQTVNSLGLYVLSIAVGAHFIDMALAGGILFVLVGELFKAMKIPLEWSNLVYAALGLQAILTGSNMGGDLRRLIARLRRRRAGTEGATLASLPGTRAARPEPTGDVLLEARELAVEFGAVKALRGVDLTVRRGEIKGLIGPNGAGKSTLIDVLSGYLPHHTGTVTLDGVDLTDLPPHRRARAGLRRTFQQDRVPTSMTVGEFVRFIAKDAAGRDDIDDVLAFFGLPAAPTPLALVDVGSRRIIEVAANVAARPALLLLDEPAAGLSHDEHIAFGDRLRAVPERFGVTMLIVEHDLDLVRSVCSGLVVLNFGEVLADGPQDEVLSNPDVLKAYMGETELL